MLPLPILYSFRRCPYAARARLAIQRSAICVELREIVLNDKPQQMLDVSPKGTVPVLILPDGRVMDESLEISLWAESQHPQGQPVRHNPEAQLQLIAENDTEFKHWLDRYKYQVGYPEHSAAYYRTQAQPFLAKLDSLLNSNHYLFGSTASLADICILPFVRQFAFVDKQWFDQSPYPGLQKWLAAWLASEEFARVMKKYPLWLSDPAKQRLFGG